MAKKVSKAKAAGKKKVGRKKAAVKRAPAKKPTAKAKKATKVAKKAAPAGKAAPQPTGLGRTEFAAMLAPKPAMPKPAPARTDDSRAAVVDCVNRFMDVNRHGWNADLKGDDRKMGANYHYPPPSIPVPVLEDIRTCLNNRRPQPYTFPTTPALVAACAAGSVADMKYEIWQVTTTI
jgi:hypothetical protein